MAYVSPARALRTLIAALHSLKRLVVVYNHSAYILADGVCLANLVARSVSKHLRNFVLTCSYDVLCTLPAIFFD
jgi:hypothetical protein